MYVCKFEYDRLSSISSQTVPRQWDPLNKELGTVYCYINGYHVPFMCFDDHPRPYNALGI